jgi:hypothetical protein
MPASAAVQGYAGAGSTNACDHAVRFSAAVDSPLRDYGQLTSEAGSLLALLPSTLLAAFNVLRVPAMAVDYFANPPPGLDLTESRTASNNAVGTILFALSALFVGLRLLTRLKLKREPLGLDDYLMFVGLALNAGNLACCIAGEMHCDDRSNH